MTEPRTPSEVFLALVTGIAEGNPEGLVELYAEKIDVSHPFDPFHSAPLTSREELRKRFDALASRGPRPRRTVGNVTIHQTTDPEVIVAEFAYQGTDEKTSEPYSLPAIFVMRVVNGEIVTSRDYHDHLASARVHGQVDQLFTALKA